MTNDQLIAWAKEIQALAQSGLYYTKDKFDRERFERLRVIASEMVADRSELPVEKVQELFAGDVGYQTPKLDTRAAIFNDRGEILLVEESDHTWSLPGGWVELNLSVAENTVKEVQEEAGLTVKPLRLIAVQDRDKHNLPKYIYGVTKIFVLCENLGGHFEANLETLQTAYFSLDNLPELAEAKNNRQQIELCFNALADPQWQVVFD